MKKLLSVLLSLCVLLGLTGCGSLSGEEKKTLSQVIEELENWRPPGLREEEHDQGPDAVSGTDPEAVSDNAQGETEEDPDAVLLTHETYVRTFLSVVGEWSELSDALPLFRPIISWFGTMKLQEDGSYASASGTGTWELSPDGSQITLYGSRGRTLVDIVQDGSYLKLSVPELRLNFLRRDELSDYIKERFVFVRISQKNVGDYIASPVNIGEILDEKDKKTGKSAWVLGSPVFEDGLVYYGRSENFRIVLQNNSTGTMTVSIPYDTLQLTTGATFGKVIEAEGTLVFVRSEYVSDNRMTDARTRTLTFWDGTSHTTSLTWFSDLADYKEWQF